eukprot:scaffold81028_cov102-Cyclotella_meneghiniana.AAC.1
MEQRLGPGYDPLDRNFPPPIPINERLLPGLFLGKGGLKLTHTKRESIEHRLLCLLLNKLCHNYYKLSQKETLDNCFAVVCNGEKCYFPEQLLQALVHCGHNVEVCPRVITTNFGLQLCVKEEDNSFTSIPTTLFLLTGVERPKDSRPCYFGAPHGGMDVRISGPIIGKTKEAWIQFYVAISALGMCNDSSTLIDFALRGKTNAYPLVSTGRYLTHIVNYFIKLKEELSLSNHAELLKPVGDNLICLIKSAGNLPSDLHITPASIIDLAERYDKSYGVEIFQATVDAKAILASMANSAREYFE